MLSGSVRLSSPSTSSSSSCTSSSSSSTSIADGCVEATAEEGWSLCGANAGSTTIPSDESGVPDLPVRAEGEKQSMPGDVVGTAVMGQDILRSNGRMSSLNDSGSFFSSAGSVCASELARMLSGSRASSSSSFSVADEFTAEEGRHLHGTNRQGTTMPSAETGAPIPIGAEGGRKSMRRDAESPAVVRCTNMRGCTLPQQAPVAPEREGAGETVEGTAVVQRHFMRNFYTSDGLRLRVDRR